MLRIRGRIASSAIVLITMLTGTLGLAVTAAQAAGNTPVTAAHSTSQTTSTTSARWHCHRHHHRCWCRHHPRRCHHR